MKYTLALFGGLLVASSWSAREARAQAAAPDPAAVAFDFRTAGAVQGWVPLHDVQAIGAAPEGLAVRINGRDPYFRSPAINLPEGVPLAAVVRVKVEHSGDLQLFYARGGQETEEVRSVRKSVAAGGWRDVTIHLPPLGPGTYLRIDPPGSSGVCLIESIRIAPRLVFEAKWPAPGIPNPPADGPAVASGSLVLRQDPARYGGFILSVDGRDFATGHDHPAIAYQATVAGKPTVKWLDVAQAGGKVETEIDPSDHSLRVRTSVRDEDGAVWSLSQAFRPHSPGVIAFEAECAVDAPRPVFHAPLLVVLPGHGLGPFGASKGQAILAGVEYLENEPSSSTADLGEADALRKVSSAPKLTFPLMAIQARGKYLGMIWDRVPGVAPLFDSPDRTLGGRGHLMGLIAPGADGSDRVEGSLFPDVPLVLAPGSPAKATGLLIAGQGSTIVPAVQKYVALKGLPPIPTTPGLQDYIRLAAAGWLDSPIRDGGRYRHAAGGDAFKPQPAADAAWMMSWLAALTDDAALADRLRAAAVEAEAAVRPEQDLHAAVGHNRYPVAPLVLSHAGMTEDSGGKVFDRAVATAFATSRWFEPDGTRRFKPGRDDKIDYGRTHFSDEADGYAGQPIDHMLRLAAFSGDKAAVDEALRLLYVLRDRFQNGVPRGAQTWEIALHTPDVLASAYLVRAFALGYELTGDPTLLDAAKYWAWTGVPFVYLVDPTAATGPGAVGPYATPPVLGSTNWVAPNWIGLPVQWCGLVYADALIELARHDAEGPWSRIADGIAASGILQTYPIGHASQGLLPDSFNPLSQARNPADINPGTLLPGALRLLAGPRARPYQFRALRASGIWVCAAGSVDVESDERGEAVFQVHAWSPGASFVVVHGLDARATTEPAAVGRRGTSAILPLAGPGPKKVTIRTPN
ncbi:hypothetical protein [Paludisphaera mucosa]|uniref:Uncharacterized protein n=1 Tax=Paludisphaera mucosa TaxID=3030827 RepID=A0ABT6F4G4_9BACT|nr:hypothetical protein [Paludisphaera mucosa]MDG3002482.1 hypothetical protein [Paludisphaera mucosa]